MIQKVIHFQTFRSIFSGNLRYLGILIQNSSAVRNSVNQRKLFHFGANSKVNIQVTIPQKISRFDADKSMFIN